MATMVNRKVWFRYATAIDSGTVIQQKFNPDCLTIRRDRDGQEFQFSPLSIFLTPQEAINDARDYAQLLNYNADKLEAALTEEDDPLWFHRKCVEKQRREAQR